LSCKDGYAETGIGREFGPCVWTVMKPDDISTENFVILISTCDFHKWLFLWSTFFAVLFPEGKCYEIIHVLLMNVHVMNLKKPFKWTWYNKLCYYRM